MCQLAFPSQTKEREADRQSEKRERVKFDKRAFLCVFKIEREKGKKRKNFECFEGRERKKKGLRKKKRKD